MRGAPQVGFSATMRKIRSRTSLNVCLLRTCLLALETNPQYSRKPPRCQRTTVSGVTHDEGQLPTGPDSPSNYPEEPVEGTKVRPRMAPFQHDKLLA